MNIVCLDMEGVLVPEIWIAFAEESGIPELRRTTRDEPDYDKLMRWRIDILRQHGLGLTDIQNTIRRIDPPHFLEPQRLFIKLQRFLQIQHIKVIMHKLKIHKFSPFA